MSQRWNDDSEDAYDCETESEEFEWQRIESCRPQVTHRLLAVIEADLLDSDENDHMSSVKLALHTVLTLL